MNWNHNNDGDQQNPWGRGNNNNRDFDEILRNMPDWMKNKQNPMGPKINRNILWLIVLAAFIVWLISGFYNVRPDEIGVVTRFGKYNRSTLPGLNYHLPTPFEAVIKPKVESVTSIDVGSRSALQKTPMLTGDENIIEVDFFTVFWRVDPDKIENFLFNVRNVPATIEALAESAMREIIGKSNIQPILTGARADIEARVQDKIQEGLDFYEAGVAITQVSLQSIDPPQPVIEDFREVQRARADQEATQNAAQAKSNQIIPSARGDATVIVQGAQAEMARLVGAARGEAEKFNQVARAFNAAPNVTRFRLYMETIEEVIQNSDVSIIDGELATSTLPILQLQGPNSNSK